MPTSVRERQARLLADSRSSEPRARLAQAVSRAEFLLRVSRTASAIQNPQRALEALVALLVEDLVDVARVVVRNGARQLTGSGASGLAPRSEVSLWSDNSSDELDEAIRRGVGEEVALARGGHARRRALSSLLVDDEVVAVADDLGTEQLTILPMAARGRSFGVLVLGRARGYGFAGSQGFLEDLAERIAIGLDATLAVSESRYVASVLRSSLAPAEPPTVPGLELATFYRVAHQSEDVGGDFLDVHGSADDLTLLCGDVTGKGVEAAVHAKRIRNAVRTAAMVDRSPSWVLGLVNRVLVSEAEGYSERLSTATCVRLRPGDGVLRADLGNAGHPPAFLLRTDGRVEDVQADGVALALLGETGYDETTVELGPGDVLLLYTDGVTEARGAEDLFGEARLRDHLRELGGLPASAVVESVAVAVSEHLGDRDHDDIAVVAAQFRPETR